MINENNTIVIVTVKVMAIVIVEVIVEVIVVIIIMILIKTSRLKPIGFEAPRGGAYNNRKHLKLETPCS